MSRKRKPTSIKKDIVVSWTKYHHLPGMYRDDYPAAVEINRLPVAAENTKQFSSDYVFNQIKMISSYKNCFVQSDEHKLMQNFIHSQLSHEGYLFKKSDFRDIYDLYLLSKRKDAISILNKVEEKNKLKGYFLFTEKVLNINGQFGKIRNMNAQLHCFLCDVFLRFSRLHHQYISIILFCKLFIAYLNNMVRVIYDVKYRNYIMRKYNLPCL